MQTKNIYFLLLCVVLVSSCGAPVSPTVEETERTETSVEEVVLINNCGGKSDIKRTISRSFRASVGGELTIGGDLPVDFVSAEVLAKYGEEIDTTQSVELNAPPGTNMKFVLMWLQDTRSGEYRDSKEEEKYFVYIPMGVQVVSSNDEMCDAPVDEPVDGETEPEKNCRSIEEVAAQSGWGTPNLYNAIFGGYSFQFTSQSYLPELWEADKFDNENFDTLLYQIHPYNQNREMNPGFWVVYMPNECRAQFGFYEN